MKDSEFKKLCRDTFESKSLNLYNADFEFEAKDGYCVIEYENSSRGLVHNYVKILMKNEILHNKLLVIFIRTKTHKERHELDFKRLQFLIQKCNTNLITVMELPEESLVDFLRKFKG